METEQFDQWAIVELFGHKKMAGRVTIAPMEGFLRVDVPNEQEGIKYTRYLNNKAIYAINPASEELVRRVAEQFSEPPVSRWEMEDVFNNTDDEDDGLPY